MQIKANGISINYQIEGPTSAPWLIFSNSLATNLSAWDDQARNSAAHSGCYAMISAAMAGPTPRPGATPSMVSLPMCWP